MNPPSSPEISDKEEPWEAMIDTSSPFSSVQEAVILFEGRCNAFEEVALLEVKYQIGQVERDIIAKERETLDVLKELEMTKRIAKDLKLKLQKEAMPKIHPVMDYEEHCPKFSENQVDLVDPNTSTKQSLEVDFRRTIDGLTGLLTSAQLLKSKIQNEKALLEVTRQNLSANTAEVLSLEKHLNQMTLRLQLNADIENSRLITETAKSEVSKLTAELEQTKAKIKSAEIRQHAVKKIEAEAKTSEVAALEKIKALSDSDNSNSNIQNASRVTLPVEEFLVLFHKANEVDKLSRRNIEENQSKQEAITERTEKSNRSRQSVDEARRKWRLAHVQRQHFLHNNTTKLTDRTTNEVTTKSVSSEDNNAGKKDNRKPKVTLRQLLNEEKSVRNVCKKFPTNRKKFSVLSLLNWMIKIRRTRRRRLRIRRRSMFDFSC
ncbi:WEB family protein [Dioscorea alata]|uniref:WEB family protein n=1 Tax=Dioscorea alata TaxID=55571 RepID=A0ACB7V2L7_DIOAL|nr:WEB family protein [Dioscorea alata]